MVKIDLSKSFHPYPKSGQGVAVVPKKKVKSKSKKQKRNCRRNKRISNRFLYHAK